MSPGSRNSLVPVETGRLIGKKKSLYLRARMIQAIRAYLVEQGYLEVETPQLVAEVPPEAHIDPIPVGRKWLITSPELSMKRLLAAGYDKIFQITKCFRDGERGSLHLPEFTILEWYHEGVDYITLMEETEALFLSLGKALNITGSLLYQGREVDFTARPWRRISVEEAFESYSSLSLHEALKENRFDHVMAEEVEPRLGLDGPEFIYDYPASLAALSRLKPGHKGLSERFELYIAGLELANGFSELNNSREQKQRFLAEQDLRKKMGKPVYPLPNRFLASLDHMPEAAGIAVGLDRLAMIIAGKPAIDDVITFIPEET